MHIQEYFDQIYCVNLAQRKDRWKECIKEFKRADLQNVVRIEATKGIPPELTHYGAMGLDSKSYNFEKRLEGRIGCLLSQLEVLKDARAKRFQRILLLEDDVQFVTDVQSKFSDAVMQLPDEWSLLYLGGNEKGTPEKISPNIYKVSHMLMAHAVGIHESVFEELIAYMESREWANDICFAMLQKKFPCFVIDPFLAWQRAGWSDLEQRYRIFDFKEPKPYLLGMAHRESK